MSNKQTKIEKMLLKKSTNPFYRSANYEISSRLDRLNKTLQMYNVDAESVNGTMLETVSTMTPEFQRANTQWDLAKKVRFIENVLAGFRQFVVLFFIKNDTASCSQILDGLQRLSAIADFMNNEFAIYDDMYFSDMDTGQFFMDAMVGVRVFEFDTLVEAVQFYIDMNEGFTHSDADIEKAQKFKSTL